MSTSRTCPQCGAKLPEAAFEGLCPRCLGDWALNPDADLKEPPANGPQPKGASEPPETRRFADFELLEEIARGGMGVVYKARQRSLNRLVALKMILTGHLASKEQIERFRAEAQAAAHLQHPNIVAIHEVGEVEGQHFFSMDYVEGRNLAQVISDFGFRISDFRRLGRWMRTIAEAVHYAHQHGIIHRDLKPSNVLIDGNDQPRITDFGLAKKLDDSQPSTFNPQLTLSGQVLGSPNYLPPEQAGGKRGAVGPASDVYALGAILYHLLTGRPPFQAEPLTTLIRQVLETEPVAPRLLNPSIPRDLETICLRCLEKEIPRRYASAQALADELGRYLEDQPIQARPVRLPEKVWRWCRRKPMVAGLGATSVLLLLAVAIGAPIAAYRINRERQRAEAEKLANQRTAYNSDMSLAFQALAGNNLDRVQELLDRHRPSGKSALDLRHWEWRFLWEQCQGQFAFKLCERPRTVTKLAYKADGELAVGESWGPITFWDVATRQMRFESPQSSCFRGVAFCAARNLVAQGIRMPRFQPDEIVVWDAATRKTVPQRPILTGASPQYLAFSPDGRLLAGKQTYAQVGKTIMQVWQVDAGTLIGSPLSNSISTRSGLMEFGSTGDLLAVGEDHGTIRLIEVPSGREKTNFVAGSGAIFALTFSPEDHLLASGAGEDPIVRLWNLKTGRRTDLTGHVAEIISLAFDRTGQILASGSADQTIRLWDVAERRCLACLRGHRERVTSLVFSPDGRLLVSGEWAKGTRDAPVYCWDVSRYLRDVSRLPVHREAPYRTLALRTRSVAFSLDSRTLFTASGAVVRFDAATLRPLEELKALGTNNCIVALSPDGRWLAAGQSNGTVRVWEADRLRELTNFGVPSASSEVSRLGFLGPGRLVRTHAFGESYGTIIWDTTTWREREPWSSRGGPPVIDEIAAADASPDGSMLATGHVDGSIRLWNAPSGQPVASLVGHKYLVASLAFSPDGRWLASTGSDGSVQLWDLAARPRHLPLQGHNGPVFAVAFSSDSRRLAGMTAAPNEGIVLWDMTTQQLVATLTCPGAASGSSSISFSPDGHTLVTIDSDGQTHFWRAPSFAEIEAAEKEKASLQSSSGPPAATKR